MYSYDFLIVGGGMAADSAIKGIRLVNSAARIGLVGEEPYPPYNRPPLSKALWDGMPIDEIWRPTRGRQVEMHLGRTIESIDLQRRVARDQRGEVYRFGRLLLAVGGRPARLPGDDAGVIYFRTLADYRRLRTVADAKGHVVIVGGGLIGTEVAAALRKAGSPVTLVCGRAGPGGHLLPPALSDQMARLLRTHGVTVEEGVRVAGLERGAGSTGEHVLRLSDGRRLSAARVVAGVGLQPNVELARAAGLAVGRGILVNAQMQTSHPDVFAAGDCCEYPCPALGGLVQSQHEEHANFSGIAAGRAMAGSPLNYSALPYFYSRLFELNYEGIGRTDPRLETVTVSRPGAAEAIVYYLDAGRVRGVLFWNARPDLERAAALIESMQTVDRDALPRLIPLG
jgi:NADPH-dependent 2,4-dienoyl-CoA reductase/sulfur reductase-like enzyme